MIILYIQEYWDLFHLILNMSFLILQILNWGVVPSLMVLTESVASLRRRMMLAVLSRATNTSLTEEPCLVTLEEGLLFETEFFEDPLLGGDAQVVDAPTEQDTSAIDDDFEEVSTNITPTGFLPFDPERVVEEGKRNLHQVMYHIVMHLTAQNHPVMRNIEFLTRASNEIINAWYLQHQKRLVSAGQRYQCCCLSTRSLTSVTLMTMCWCFASNTLMNNYQNRSIRQQVLVSRNKEFFFIFTIFLPILKPCNI